MKRPFKILGIVITAFFLLLFLLSLILDGLPHSRIGFFIFYHVVVIGSWIAGGWILAYLLNFIDKKTNGGIINLFVLNRRPMNLNKLKRLEKLAELKDKGIITETEFEEQRKKIIPSSENK